jgi:hypothetical protein
MIWGDQHDTRFFDFFAEKHLLSHFNRILRQPANRRGEVPQQVQHLLHVCGRTTSSRECSTYLQGRCTVDGHLTCLSLGERSAGVADAVDPDPEHQERDSYLLPVLQQLHQRAHHHEAGATNSLCGVHMLNRCNLLLDGVT